MATTDKVLSAVADAIKKLVEDSWQDVRDSALKDGQAFLRRTRTDLARWADLLAKGNLKPDEFEFLVQSKKDLAVMERLKQEGLTRARLMKFRRSLLSTVIGAALAAI